MSCKTLPAPKMFCALSALLGLTHSSTTTASPLFMHEDLGSWEVVLVEGMDLGESSVFVWLVELILLLESFDLYTWFAYQIENLSRIVGWSHACHASMPAPEEWF